MEFNLFKKYPELVYGFSEKSDGPMFLASKNEIVKDELENKKRFLNSLGIKESQVITAQLNHTANISVVTDVNAGKIIPNCDGLVTKSAGLYLSVTGSDCFPVYFYEPDQRFLGLVHTGWRGVVRGAAINLIKVMENELSANPSKIKIGVGPGIQAHHFEIKEDVLPKFIAYPEMILRQDEKLFVDLPGILNRQFLESGIKPDNIEISKDCTYCLKDKYFSFRRDKPKRIQAMLAFIGIRNPLRGIFKGKIF